MKYQVKAFWLITISTLIVVGTLYVSIRWVFPALLFGLWTAGHWIQNVLIPTCPAPSDVNDPAVLCSMMKSDFGAVFFALLTLVLIVGFVGIWQSLAVDLKKEAEQKVAEGEIKS